MKKISPLISLFATFLRGNVPLKEYLLLPVLCLLSAVKDTVVEQDGYEEKDVHNGHNDPYTLYLERIKSLKELNEVPIIILTINLLQLKGQFHDIFDVIQQISRC
jgi:hypothetical protein